MRTSNRGRIRRPLSAVLLSLVAFALCACGDTAVSSPGGSTAGLVDEDWMRERQLDYLRFATQSVGTGSVLNVIAHMERDRIDPEYTAPIAAVAPDAFERSFEKISTLQDTRDFDGLYLLNLWLGYRDHPMLAPGTAERIEESLANFKLWFTEPTPEGLIDNSYYWTENHQVLFHTIEYLLGQEMPDRPLSTDRRTGAEHREIARERLLRWLDQRARFGFAEWHSNVYYQKDVTPLLTLIEFADDEELRDRATMILDVLLYDMATHTIRGAFGATHGRSYKKDKMTSRHDDTWGGVKLLFDTTPIPYQSTSHPDATLLARAKRYRMPEVIRRIATSTDTYTERERMSLPIDLAGPYDPEPEAPFGFDYTDEENLDVWWGIGALTAWPVAPLTLEIFERYNLWQTQSFLAFADLAILVDAPVVAQQLAISAYRFFAFGVLDQVNTVTHRNAEYMLSTAVDYNAGSFRSQIHTWQLTFDPDALVFTSHPFRPNPESLDWSDRDNEQGGYWTGDASIPRSAQYENVGIHIYAPQYPRRNSAPFTFFRYEDFTHAFVPRDHMDEVVSEGNWTFARKGDGYVGLWSWRPTRWVAWDPEVYANNGMVQPYDLVADGGADTVWIVEGGRAADWGSFEEFRRALAASVIEVVPLGERSEDGISPGFDVTYESPSQGRMEFGWERPFVVAGSEVPLSEFPRIDGPFGSLDFDGKDLSLRHEGYGVDLDFGSWTREVSAP